ncbi:SMP-30/Gluconolaconase/LRE-like region domain-containing protein [Sarocladium implicatum]|nr:SMP-30/Gluconolaconase/LRE-like region domain-containing protein [Sarocladium implicatum]
MLPTVLAQPLSLSSKLPSKTVAQLPNGSWFENIAVRSNGDLLVTSVNENPGLYIMRDPTSPTAELDHIISPEDLGGANIALGLAEIVTDDEVETFGLIAGRATGLAQFVKGSYSIWTVKFRKSKCGQETIDVEKVTDGTDSSLLLNGMTAIPGVPNVALVADSAGLVARVDLNSGEFDDKSFAFTETMAPSPNASLPIGVNGVHVQDSHLYWTNSALTTIFRIALTEDGYPKAGAEPEVVVDLSNLTALLDDFIFDGEGNIWVAAFDTNSLIRVDAKTMEGKIVAGSPKELILPGVTAAAFGRGKKDQDLLYLTTSGGLGGPVDGKTEGAKVVAVDTSAFPC